MDFRENGLKGKLIKWTYGKQTSGKMDLREN